MGKDDLKSGIMGDAASYTAFESLDSISDRLPLRREMHLNIYDQTDVHLGYLKEGVCDGPSPELIERSLHRMAESSAILSMDRDGKVCERTLYVAAVDTSALKDRGLPDETILPDIGRMTVYSDDGLDLILGSHDVFELITDLRDLFMKIVATSLYDAGFADPASQRLIFLEREFADEQDGPAEIMIDIGLRPSPSR